MAPKLRENTQGKRHVRLIRRQSRNHPSDGREPGAGAAICPGSGGPWRGRALAARQTDKLKSLEEEIRGKGGRAAAVALDVTDTASIARAVDAAEAVLGPVTVLINNAGIAIEKLATEQTEAD